MNTLDPLAPSALDLDTLANVTGGQHTDPIPEGPTPSVKDLLKPRWLPRPLDPFPGERI